MLLSMLSMRPATTPMLLSTTQAARWKDCGVRAGKRAATNGRPSVLTRADLAAVMAAAPHVPHSLARWRTSYLWGAAKPKVATV